MPPRETWTQLSTDVGFPARTIREWRKLPGAPGTPNVDEWKAFIDENQLGIAGNRVSKDREYWLTKKAEKDVKLQDIKIEKESRKLVDIDEVAEFVANLLLGVKQAGYQMARELPRQCVGLELAEAQAKAQPYMDQMMLDLQAKVRGWWPEEVETPEAEDADE